MEACQFKVVSMPSWTCFYSVGKRGGLSLLMKVCNYIAAWNITTKLNRLKDTIVRALLSTINFLLNKD